MAHSKTLDQSALRGGARWASIEFWILAALLLVLPTLEAPKNILLVIYPIVWIVRRWGMPQARFDRIELAVCSLFVVSTISTIANWPFPNTDKGMVDTFKIVSVFLLVYRGGYSVEQLRLLAKLVVLSVVIGLIVGGFDLANGRSGTLQLHSAGVVTQSAIFVGIVVLTAAGLAAERVERPLVAALFIILIGLFFMGSRGAIGAVLLAGAVLVVMFKDRRLWVYFAVTVAAAVALTLSLPDRFDQQRYVMKSAQLMTGEAPRADQERQIMWRIGAHALTTGQSNLIYGLGPRNFSSINIGGVTWPESMHYRPKLTHAHNLFLTKLVEEGLLGVGALLAVFMLVGGALYQDWRASDWRHWSWFGAYGALTVSVIAGSFNTPFYQEHALLAMFLFAAFFAHRRGRGATV